MRKEVSFTVRDIRAFKDSLLLWAQRFTEITWLDSNLHADPYGSFDALLAVGALTSIRMGSQGAFQSLRQYHEQTRDWLFGYLSYDLKNDVERLRSENPDKLEFPDLFFFQPKKMIRIRGNQVDFMYQKHYSDEIESDFEYISKGITGKGISTYGEPDIRIHMGIFKDQYFEKVRQMKHHIHRGDIYEANFCQEFYATNTQIDPFRTYKKLNK
ncbi:MAG: aminodeoxychorismate synthase component I, partial [Bacteroidota bacterium]